MKTLRKNDEKDLMKELAELEQRKKEFAEIKKIDARIKKIKEHFKKEYPSESIKSGDLYILVDERKSLVWSEQDLLALLGKDAKNYYEEKVTVYARFKDESAKKAA